MKTPRDYALTWFDQREDGAGIEELEKLFADAMNERTVAIIKLIQHEADTIQLPNAYGGTFAKLHTRNSLLSLVPLINKMIAEIYGFSERML